MATHVDAGARGVRTTESIIGRSTARGGLAGLITGAVVGTLLVPLIGTIVGGVIGFVTGLVLGLVCGISLVVVAYEIESRDGLRAAGAGFAAFWGTVAVAVVVPGLPYGWLYPVFALVCALNGAIVAPGCVRYP